MYDQYGVAGDYWAATNLQCSDMTSLIGNNVAGMVFDAAKSIDRVTITVYQSAAGEGILSWLQRVTDTLITSLGNAIYFPYLAVVIILAAIWLAWQGLIRKRAYAHNRGHGLDGRRLRRGHLPHRQARGRDRHRPRRLRRHLAGSQRRVRQAAESRPDQLRSRPEERSAGPADDATATPRAARSSTRTPTSCGPCWSASRGWSGEFGTSAYSTGAAKPTAVNTYGRALLWSQAIAVDEKATPALIQAKQDAYAGIASSIQSNDPAIYPLFQGKQWTTRLEVAFAALFAAVVAGVLVLLISVTLILLKLSFLLLLIVGPFFLLIGAHPGFGRVVALRWVELLIGVLLKQAAIALVLSVLLYCYALIMGTSDAVLPWALKILMIALVTVAAFIYRKPFQHLFSAVGYGVIGSQDRAEADLARAGATARANTLAAATAAVPPFAAYRAARWARRNPGQAASLAMAAASGGAAAAVAAGLQAGEAGSGAAVEGTVGDGTAAGPGSAASGTVASGVPAGDGTGRMALTARARAAAASAASAAEPPPLNLPSRNGAGQPPLVSCARPAGCGRAGADGGGWRRAGWRRVGGWRRAGWRRAAGGSLAGGGTAPGAWPVGRGVSPTIQGSLRQPAAPTPRQASGPAPRQSGVPSPGQARAPAGQAGAPTGRQPARPLQHAAARVSHAGAQPASPQQDRSQRTRRSRPRSGTVAAGTAAAGAAAAGTGPAVLRASLGRQPAALLAVSRSSADRPASRAPAGRRQGQPAGGGQPSRNGRPSGNGQRSPNGRPSASGQRSPNGQPSGNSQPSAQHGSGRPMASRSASASRVRRGPTQVSRDRRPVQLFPGRASR